MRRELFLQNVNAAAARSNSRLWLDQQAQERLRDLHLQESHVASLLWSTQRQWTVGYNSNCVCQEVMFQLPGRHEYCVEQFLHLWIPYLSVNQDFTDELHGLLLDLRYCLWLFNGDDCADHYVGSRHVQYAIRFGWHQG
jgi:hypothetical protein